MQPIVESETTTQTLEDEIQQTETEEKGFENEMGSLRDMLQFLTQFPIDGCKTSKSATNEAEEDEDDYSSLESTSSHSFSDWKFVIGALSNAFQTTYKLKDEESVFCKYAKDPSTPLTPKLVDFVGEFMNTNGYDECVDIVDWVLTQMATVNREAYINIEKEADENTSAYELFSKRYPELITNYVELSELRFEYELNDLIE